MAQVHGNPDEMRKFSAHLTKIAGDLRMIQSVTRSKMHHLNETWKDQENVKFIQRFEQDIKPLNKLIETLDEYSEFLKRKAYTLEKYLNTRL